MTIKEMAIKAAKKINEEPFGSYTRGYEDGANEVLKDIEDIVRNNEDNTLCMARCLINKIQELRRN